MTASLHCVNSHKRIQWLIGLGLVLALGLIAKFVLEVRSDSSWTLTQPTAAQSETESQTQSSLDETDSDDALPTLLAIVTIGVLFISIGAPRLFGSSQHHPPLLQPPQSF